MRAHRQMDMVLYSILLEDRSMPRENCVDTCEGSPVTQQLSQRKEAMSA